METSVRAEERSTVELVKDAFSASEELIKAEIALAKHETLREVAAVKRFIVMAGVAAVLAILGLIMLLVAAVLALPLWAVSAAILGALLLAVALTTGLFGYLALPQKPVAQTQENLKADLRVLKEQLT